MAGCYSEQRLVSDKPTEEESASQLCFKELYPFLQCQFALGGRTRGKKDSRTKTYIYHEDEGGNAADRSNDPY